MMDFVWKNCWLEVWRGVVVQVVVVVGKSGYAALGCKNSQNVKELLRSLGKMKIKK